jgi:hypothetical protein
LDDKKDGTRGFVALISDFISDPMKAMKRFWDDLKKKFGMSDSTNNLMASIPK